ncbi:MAG: DUF3179 domain-containing protein [Haloarculaceae archaeon]
MTVRDVLPRDAIPSIDDPVFDREYAGEGSDEVIVVDGDPPRAYPLRILSYHEVVNDTVDGRPVAVTWCPICWSAVVYDRRVAGRTLTFGVSGKLADDALVLYDRETGSEWKQTSGRAIAGDLAGHRLDTLPAPIVPYRRFREDSPDGLVLQPARGPDDPELAMREYDMRPYEAYAAGDHFGLYGMRGAGEPREWNRDDLDPKARVVGVEHGGEAVGYPLDHVRAAGGVVTDTVGGLDVVVFAVDGGHVFENPGLQFERDGDRFRADGAIWDPTSGASEDGRRLERVRARRLFAFAWQDDHGADAFFSP